MLTGKQERFVAEYLVDLNATGAARRAGYRQPHVQGPRLLNQQAVARAIALGQKERAERTRLSADWVIDRLRTEAQATEQGNQAGRIRALELLGKHLGLFRETVDQNVGPQPVHVVETLVTTRAEAKQILAALDRYNGQLPITSADYSDTDLPEEPTAKNDL